MNSSPLFNLLFCFAVSFLCVIKRAQPPSNLVVFVSIHARYSDGFFRGVGGGGRVWCAVARPCRSLSCAIDPGIVVQPCIALSTEERSSMFQRRYRKEVAWIRRRRLRLYQAPWAFPMFWGSTSTSTSCSVVSIQRTFPPSAVTQKKETLHPKKQKLLTRYPRHALKMKSHEVCCCAAKMTLE